MKRSAERAEAAQAAFRQVEAENTRAASVGQAMELIRNASAVYVWAKLYANVYAYVEADTDSVAEAIGRHRDRIGDDCDVISGPDGTVYVN